MLGLCFPLFPTPSSIFISYSSLSPSCLPLLCDNSGEERNLSKLPLRHRRKLNASVVSVPSSSSSSSSSSCLLAYETECLVFH
ncbi:hypothetical protein E2C01_032330 [Portunus trituberculatus]|uniref:Uncharacterized protein n=1 Tax=Portunus trituberculatus TaxID=210409 RepID=A0A5B7F2I0_PORTR|nr:hypothetical protein [Portunus trituberculatus]